MKKSETSPFLCNYLYNAPRFRDLEILVLFSLIKQIPNCCITNMQVLRQAHCIAGKYPLAMDWIIFLVLFGGQGITLGLCPIKFWKPGYDWSESKVKMTS